MKRLLLIPIFAVVCAATAGAQTIAASPSVLTATGTPPSIMVTTLTATGLTPATGNITVDAPAKYMVSLNGTTWDYSLSIPYTGGNMAATTVYVKYVFTSSSAWSQLDVHGGGATAEFCLCVNMSPCPCATTAVGEIAAAAKETVLYPNPVTSILTISGNEDIKSIEVTDVAGRTVQSAMSLQGKAQVEVNVSRLPEGVYFVRINGTRVERFVKE